MYSFSIRRIILRITYNLSLSRKSDQVGHKSQSSIDDSSPATNTSPTKIRNYTTLIVSSYQPAVPSVSQREKSSFCVYSIEGSNERSRRKECSRMTFVAASQVPIFRTIDFAAACDSSGGSVWKGNVSFAIGYDF